MNDIGLKITHSYLRENKFPLSVKKKKVNKMTTLFYKGRQEVEKNIKQQFEN